MSRTSAENRANLRKWAEEARRRAAVEAVRAGQAVIASGLRSRCPAGAARKILGTIRPTAIGSNPGFVGGFVIVASPLASRVEARHPFVAPTSRVDGPRALKAMVATLERLL